MNQPRGRMLFYCEGSLVDHVDRDCSVLRDRIAARGHAGHPLDTGGVRQRYVTGGSVIPLCALCAPERVEIAPTTGRRRWGRVWAHGGRVYIEEPARGLPPTRTPAEFRTHARNVQRAAQS